MSHLGGYTRLIQLRHCPGIETSRHFQAIPLAAGDIIQFVEYLGALLLVGTGNRGGALLPVVRPALHKTSNYTTIPLTLFHKTVVNNSQ